MNSVTIDTDVLLKQVMEVRRKACFERTTASNPLVRNEQAKLHAYYVRVEELLLGINKNITNLSTEWLISFTELRKTQLLEEIKLATTQRASEYKTNLLCFHIYIAIFLETLIIESETV